MGRELKRLLKQYNCELIRRNKHYVYRLPNGSLITISMSSSDRHHLSQVEKDLKRLVKDKNE